MGFARAHRTGGGAVDENSVEKSFKTLKSVWFVYIYSESGIIAILALYVDGVFLLGKGLKTLGRIKQELMSRFSMTDMENTSWASRCSSDHLTALHALLTTVL